MKKEPKLSDFIPRPISKPETGISWHNESLKKDLINNQTADEFYLKFGDDLQNSLKKYIDENIPFDILIEDYSTKAASTPAIDIKYEAIQIEKENIHESDIVKWRIEKFWKHNVKNMIDAFISQAESIYDKEKRKHDEYIKYYSSLTEEEKKEDDNFRDYGLL
jgi:hypothetical protein